MTSLDGNDTPDPAPRAVAATSALGYRSVSYYLPAALHARLKAAWWSTRDRTGGSPSLAGLVEDAFEREARRLEHQLNGGSPFPPAPARAQGATRRSLNGYRHCTYYLPAELHGRLKAAWWATREDPAGAATLAGLVESALGREATMLEEKHNQGEAFPPAPPGARGISRAAAERQGEWLRGEWERRRRAATPSPSDEGDPT